MQDARVAPKDPAQKRAAFYVLLDKPVGGIPNNDGVGRHPIFLNDERLVTFAKMVGGVSDESLLEMLRTAKGFRKAVHSIGISITGDLPDKTVKFSLGFSGPRGEAGSRNSVELITDGMERKLEVAELTWSDTDERPAEFLFELAKPKDMITATVKLYLNDGYQVPEMDPDPPVAFDTPAYQEMIARSCLSTGNNARLKKVFKKLRAGEDVTLAFLGGSITQGAGAVPIQSSCYARLTYEAICRRYAAAPEKVRYIKAGVGGTPSQLGLHRYRRDITRDGTVQPDLVVVEFAVNDLADETKGLCYESLVKAIWDGPGKPAVILLFSVFANDWNLKQRLAPIGWRHQIPMVDVLEAVSPQFRSGVGETSVITRRQYFYDVFHPSNHGHRVMKDCLMYLLQRLDGQQPMEEPVQSPAYYGFDYAGLQFFDRSCLPQGTQVKPGSFSLTDTDLQSVPLDFDEVNTPQFPFNWKKGPGKEPFELRISCSALQMVFKDSGSPEFGRAVVTVDGQALGCYDPREAGWTHCHATVLFNRGETKPHTVQIQMHPDDEDKAFTILGFGWVE